MTGSTVWVAASGAGRFGADRILTSVVTGVLVDGLGADVVVHLPDDVPVADIAEYRDIDVRSTNNGVIRRSSGGGPLRLGLRVGQGFRRWYGLLRSGPAPDLVYVNSATTLGPVLACLARRVPFVWHIHEDLSDERLLVRLVRPLMKRSARTIFVSSAAAAGSGLADADNTVVIRNGLPDAPALPTDEVPRLVYFGRIATRKGLDTFLELSRSLDRPELEWQVWGEAAAGAEDSLLADLAEWHQASPRHTFGGPYDHVAEFLRSSDVALFPFSRPEAFPTVTIEAMRGGVPVVAYAHPALREQLADGGGLLVPVGDTPALRVAVESLLDDPVQRDQLGAAGRRTYEKLYSDAIFNAAALHTFADLLGVHR